MRIALFALMAFSFSAQAQLVRGAAKLTDLKDGTPVVQFNDSTEVFGVPKSSSWKVTKVVYFLETDLLDDETIKPDANLLDKDDQVIGKTLGELHVEEIKEVKGVRKGKYRSGLISAKAKITDFVVNTNPEDELEKLLGDKKGMNAKSIDEFCAKFGFKSDEAEGMNVRVLMNPNKSNESEPEYRLILILRGSQIQCVISRERMLTLAKVKDSSEEIMGFFNYYQKPRPADLEKFQMIAYNYLPL